MFKDLLTFKFPVGCLFGAYHGASIVGSGERAKSFLTSSVPELQFDLRILEENVLLLEIDSYFSFKGVNVDGLERPTIGLLTDCTDVTIYEGVITKPLHDARLANIGVAQQ